jgi:hypothetical protein
MRSGPPRLWWHFPHNSSYKLSPLQGCWAGAAAPAFSGWLVYLQFAWGIAPPPLSGAWGTPPSLLHVFFFFIQLLVYYSVCFFPFFSPLGEGQSVQGAILIWPSVVCGSTICRLAHLVICVFPSSLGAGVWQCRSPSGFSV